MSSVGSLQRDPDTEEPETPLAEAGIPDRLLLVAPVVDRRRRRPPRSRQRSIPIRRRRRPPAPRCGSITPRRVPPTPERTGRRRSAVPVMPVAGRPTRAPVARPAGMPVARWPIRSTGVETAARVARPATPRSRVAGPAARRVPTGAAEFLRLGPARARRRRRGSARMRSTAGSALRRAASPRSLVGVRHAGADPHQRQAHATREGRPRDGFRQVHRLYSSPGDIDPEIDPDEQTLDSSAMSGLCARLECAGPAPRSLDRNTRLPGRVWESGG